MKIKKHLFFKLELLNSSFHIEKKKRMKRKTDSFCIPYIKPTVFHFPLMFFFSVLFMRDCKMLQQH